jgi:hypothetical protein
MTMTQARAVEANYGGFADALGGIATMILAIFGLSGVHPELLLPIAVIVFGAALLIQGGTMLSEYAGLIFPSRTTQVVEHFGGGSLPVLFLVGAAGIVLGILALIGINPGVLSAVAIIAFGAALLLSSSSVTNLQALRTASVRAGESTSGSEILASEMASGSAGTQALTGLAALVLGILAVIGAGSPAILSLVALLVVGATLVLTGSSLSGAMLSFMKPLRVETERPASP